MWVGEIGGGGVAMATACLYFSCRMVTSSPEDSGFEACNWAQSSLRSGEHTTTHDPKGCGDLTSRPNVWSVVVGEAHNPSVQSYTCGAAWLSNMEDHSTINREAGTHAGSVYSKKRSSEVRGQQYIKYLSWKP